MQVGSVVTMTAKVDQLIERAMVLGSDVGDDTARVVELRRLARGDESALERAMQASLGPCPPAWPPVTAPLSCSPAPATRIPRSDRSGALVTIVGAGCAAVRARPPLTASHCPLAHQSSSVSCPSLSGFSPGLFLQDPACNLHQRAPLETAANRSASMAWTKHGPGSAAQRSDRHG
jgi:hypothetical protein